MIRSTCPNPNSNGVDRDHIHPLRERNAQLTSAECCDRLQAIDEQIQTLWRNDYRMHRERLGRLWRSREFFTRQLGLCMRREGWALAEIVARENGNFKFTPDQTRSSKYEQQSAPALRHDPRGAAAEIPRIS